MELEARHAAGAGGATGRLERRRRRGDLRAITADGIAHSGMLGVGEAYVPAFALAVGHGDVAAGLLGSVPVCAGAVLQLLAPAGARRLGSHRRWVVASAAIQAATFLPLIVGALLGRAPLELVFGVATVYWAAAFSAGSVWNSWMAELVPSRIRPHYFAHRARISQAALAASLLGGGASLHVAAARGAPLAGFAALFALAALLRLLSSRFLWQQTDVAVAAPPASEPVARGLLAAIRTGPAGSLLAYLMAIQLCVFIAAPYFTPYMLQRLELSYGEFVVLTAAAFVSRVSVLPLLGRIARRYGPRRLLVLGSVGIAPLAALWLVSSHFAYLLCVQILAGACWAAYELAVMLMFFDSLEREQRIGVLTLFNLANALAMLAGSLVGGALLDGFGAGARGYAVVFAVSSAGRFLTLALLRRVPETGAGFAVPTRILTVRPSLGAIERPVVSALDEEEPGDAP